MVWSETAAVSEWVYGEASEAYELGTLISVSVPAFDPRRVPINFKGLHCEPIDNGTRIIAAIEHNGAATQRSARVPPDPLGELRVRVARGEAAAQAELGHKYAMGLDGLVKDEHEAARLFTLAAGQGNALGQTLLGVFYYLGMGGIPIDEPKAATLFEAAAAQGFARGQTCLGILYENGRRGLDKDEREAARHYKLAADQGDELALFILSLFYRSGTGGLPQDPLEADRLYEMAVDRGFKFSTETRMMLLERNRR